ncbi:MAG: sugar transferase [Actinobacteria bacterium 69-20]|nr:sugar transferase [Actinomycetota bacterium]OJV23947.1 MAG: sugar transferase [Actinobacteria bacterium 69-20]
MKRLVDVVVAAVALVMLSPVFALIALAVTLDSPGPIFYRQVRVGRHGRPFQIHKFRSMRAGAPGLNITVGADPRITRVGRILRKTKLDELPQLIDVLEGTMSLVGPRPEVPKYVALWPDDLRPVILSVRPGITDPETLERRNEAEEYGDAADPEAYYVSVLLPRKAQAYADYVRTRTLRGDFAILWHTARRVVVG